MWNTLSKLFGRGGDDQASQGGGPLVIKAEYMQGDRPKVFQAWNPVLREGREDIERSWTKAAARATDLIQNTAWIAGAVSQAVANNVGTGLRLVPTPDPAALGTDDAGAKKWGLDVARKFRSYASNPTECDVAGKASFGQQQAMAYKTFLAFGEIVASSPWRRRYGEVNATKVELIPPHRLADVSRRHERIFHGVKVDEDNRPLGYIFYPPKDELQTQEEDYRRARDRFNRPLICHVFDGMPGQVRGITPLAPALAVAKQFDQLSNATLASSIIQSLFAATLTADLPTEESIASLLTPREQAGGLSHGTAKFDLYHQAYSGWMKGLRFDPSIAGRVASLFPGQKLDFVTPGGIETNFAEFAKLLLREIARCLGITYEEMSGDYAGVTFSSVRMATDVIHRVIVYNRVNIMAPFCNFVYLNWLEEMIDSGRITVPGGIVGFLQNKSLIGAAEWIGSPKPVADDLKAAKTIETLYKAKIISARRAAAVMGDDIDDIYAELADEMETRKKLKIGEPQFSGLGAGGDEEDGDGEKPEPAKGKGSK